MRTRIASLGLCLAVASACAPPERPHIVLFTADTLRADHLSLFGYPRATSPRIDAFAADAWNFTQAVTVIPKTGPSFATMFTGRHPQEHGVRSNFAPVPEALPVLAERLRDAGYRTAAFVSNPALRESRGFARGFDTFRRLPEQDGVARVSRAFFEWADTEWAGGSGAPVFVWIHTIDPHGPYEPPPHHAEPFLADAWAQDPLRVPGGYAVDEATPNKVLGAVPRYQQRADGELRVASYVARYDAEIRYVDEAFGGVLDRLRADGRLDASAVVFTSDHGESLGEHDYYFEHGWFAYEPGLRVPLLLKTPGQREGRRVDAPVSNLDLLPTLLGLAGLACDCEGTDLLRDAAPGGPVLVESSDAYPEKFHGARTTAWKYLRRASDGREELYDLARDPGETRNLAGERPEVREELAGFVSRRLAALRERALSAAPAPADDPDTLRRLRELGYVE
ncbi:MAG: sulfatase [Myxococcota bacterium]